jgi:hypothetical protein
MAFVQLHVCGVHIDIQHLQLPLVTRGVCLISCLRGFTASRGAAHCQGGAAERDPGPPLLRAAGAQLRLTGPAGDQAPGVCRQPDCQRAPAACGHVPVDAWAGAVEYTAQPSFTCHSHVPGVCARVEVPQLPNHCSVSCGDWKKPVLISR